MLFKLESGARTSNFLLKSSRVWTGSLASTARKITLRTSVILVVVSFSSASFEPLFAFEVMPPAMELMLFSAALLAFFSTASAFAIDLLFNLASALAPAVAILAWVTSSVALSASVCVIVVRSSNCLSCLSCSSDSSLEDDEAPHFCRYCSSYRLWIFKRYCNCFDASIFFLSSICSRSKFAVAFAATSFAFSTFKSSPCTSLST
mmetsp:Transcript_23528/g.44254  ORF Transcript_23528/g.44254 Transcript_23528/m.44254 type:complete len:205 (-) Transcript_23528:1993-2607(-)